MLTNSFCISVFHLTGRLSQRPCLPSGQARSDIYTHSSVFFFFLSLYPLYVIPFLHINKWGDIEITIHYILENVLRNAVGSGFSFTGARRSQIATVAALMERFVTVNRAFSWYVPESNMLRDDWTECRVKDTWFMTMKHMSIKKV